MMSLSRWIALSLLCGLWLPSARGTEPAAPDVTARAWAIMDGASGKLLWSQAPDTPVKAASTTKIMCAYVILTLAEKEPAVLEERVTISKFADDTSGSTADVRQGEQVAVGELLYGLMLPSGNDAGNALAEHFNNRFAAPEKKEADGDDKPATTPRSNFVEEMNRTARQLGMAHTTYYISYGDGGGDSARTTSPADLLRLSRAAMQLERFRRIVGTRKYEGKITQPDGTPRVAEWTNTNRLLGEEGFDGVKTGSTRTAGSCLVSSQRKGDEHLLCVVLGSRSDDARYADTRALLQWAWDQRSRTGLADDADVKPLVTVQRGTLPIILTAPHGGHLAVPGAPERKGEGIAGKFVTVTDTRTAELTEHIADALEKELGGRPYVVIARFKRRFADPNRRAEHAYEHPNVRPHYEAFHHAIEQASADIRTRFSRGLLLDIHGQMFQRDAIFRGTRQGQSVRDLLSRAGNDALTGPTSIMGHLKSLGYETLPTPDGNNIGREERYTGGYIIDAHGSQRGTKIDAIQLEFGTNLRHPQRLKQTANNAAQSIAAFARKHLPPPATD